MTSTADLLLLWLKLLVFEDSWDVSQTVLCVHRQYVVLKLALGFGRFSLVLNNNGFSRNGGAL